MKTSRTGCLPYLAILARVLVRAALLLSACLALASHIPEGELAPARAAAESPGILFRENDIPSGPAQAIRAGSVLPSLDLRVPGSLITGSSRRYSAGTAGLYAPNVRWDPAALDLAGSDGVLYSSPTRAPVDSPYTHLTWERGAFTSNSFRLGFSRTLLDSVRLDLGLETTGDDSSGAFRYQDIVHQPYIGTMGRDSSKVPFGGRNLRFDGFHLLPSVTWMRPDYQLSAHYEFFSMLHEEATRREPREDTTGNRPWWFQYRDAPSSIRERTWGLGGELQLHPSPLWSANLSFASGEWSRYSEDVPKRRTGIAPVDTVGIAALLGVPIDSVPEDSLIPDTLWLGRTSSSVMGLRTGEAAFAWLALPFGNPVARVAWEMQDLHDTDLAQTRTLAQLKLSDTVSGALQLEATAGLWRNHGLDDVDWWPGGSGRIGWSDSLVQLQFVERHSVRIPDLVDLAIDDRSRPTFANPDLRVARTNQTSPNARVGRWNAGLCGGGLYEDSRDAWVPGWAPSFGDTLGDSIAFRTVNAYRIRNFSVRAGGDVALGNWTFNIARIWTLYQKAEFYGGGSLDAVPWEQRIAWEGKINWKRRVVDGKMGLEIWWDWQWMGGRTTYRLEPTIPTYTGEPAVPLELPKYLQLDFGAQMQIRSFRLYTGFDNLNHSIRAVDAGYRPPGVTFRYGIDWFLEG